MSSSSYDSATAFDDGSTQQQLRRNSTKRGSFRKLKHLITGGSKKDKRKSAGAVPPTTNSSPQQGKMMISEPIPVKVKRHNVDETRDISLKQGDKPVSVVKPMNSEGPIACDPVLEKYSSLRHEHYHRSVTPESNAGMSTTMKKEMSRSCNSLARSSLKQLSPDRDGIPVTKMSIAKRPGSRESSVTRRSPLDDVTSPTGPRSTSFSGEYGRQQQKKLHGNTSKENISSSEHINKSGNQSTAVTYRSSDSNKQTASTKHSSVASSESGLSVGFDSEQDDYSTSLEAQPWYHGRMNAMVSEMLVHKEGEFLVWETQSRPASFILTLYWDGRPQHVQLNVFEVASSTEGYGGKKGSFKYHFDNGAFDSIPELVNNHLKYQIPVSKFFDGIITTPVSRANCGVKELTMDHQPLQRSYTVSSPHGVAKKKYGGSSQSLQRNNTDPVGIYAGIMPLSHHIPELCEERDYGMWAGYRAPSESALHHVGNEDTTVYHRIGLDYHRAGMGRMKHGPLYESIYVGDRMGGYVPNSQPRKYYNLMPAQPGSSSVAYSTTSLRRPRKKRQDTGPKMSNAYNSSQDAHTMHYWSSSMSEADEKRVSVFGTMRKNKERNSRVEKNVTSVSNLSISSNLTDSDTVIGDQDSVRGSASDIFTDHKRDTVIHCLPTPKQSRAASIDSDYVYMEGIKPTPFALAFFDKSDKLDDEGEIKESPLVSTAKKQSTPHPFASSTNISMVDSKSSSEKRSPSPAAGKPSSTNVKCQSELNRVEEMFVAYHVEELAQHLTLADAVLMQLIPRPRESEAAFWERLSKEGACDGNCVGLEVLGLPEGERLWNKLMNRHHSISQWVQACVVCSDNIEQRAKIIAKFVELARALQSSCFGNVFAFFAVMAGLTTSQVSGLSQTWLEFHSSYPALSETFNNQLQQTHSALQAGAKVFALEYVSVPPVQSLGDTYFPNYSLSDSSIDSQDSEGLMEDFSNFATSLEKYRNLLYHCASFSYNSRKRLSNYKYDQKLFEYFLQDHPREILHRMELGVNLEDPTERKRRFSVILQALIERPTK